MATLWIYFFAATLLGSLAYYHLSREQDGAQLPPGPARWPIIGNISDMPSATVPAYRHWLQHKEKYGTLSSIQIMGQAMVILHDWEAIKELLEKRSKVTSGRPHMEFAHNLAGYGGYVTSQSYNQNFRLQRKLMHQQLGTKKIVDQYSPIQRVETGCLLLRVLEQPEKLIDHFRYEAGASILKMTYGYSVERTKTDPLVRLVDRMMENFSKAFQPLAWPVDALPALKYVPDWIPGVKFKKTAREWNFINQLVVNIPYSFAKQQMTTDDYQASMTSRLIQDCRSNDGKEQLQQQDEEGIKWAAATLYGGGADTTVSSLTSFVLAMMKFPEVQKKAQAEIDGVVGQSRLPQFEDRDNLPYVDAVVKETLRWFPVAPMGVPHTAVEDTEYKGYRIKKGTILIPGVWWLLHDPQVYESPDVFDPTRFISPRDEPDPATFCFGFGRRVCPGRLVADTSLWLTIAQLLACFKIEKPLDDNGLPIEPRVQSTPGLVDHPAEYSYKITPRSAAHRGLVMSLKKECYSQEGDSGRLQNLSSIERILGTA